MACDFCNDKQAIGNIEEDGEVYSVCDNCFDNLLEQILEEELEGYSRK